MKHYHVIVVGAGPAGLAGGNKTKEHDLDTVILEADSQPRVLYPPPKGNWELVRRMLADASDSGVEIRYQEEVTGLHLSGERKVVETEIGSYSCDALILAVGYRRKGCRIPGATWIGRGVGYCAECHGYLFKGKDVAVIGSGNEAVEESLYLADVANEVTLIAHPTKLNADYLLTKKARNRGIAILEGYFVERIEGDMPSKAIKLQSVGASKAKEIGVNGVFIVMELKPSTLTIKQAGIKMHRLGCITVDQQFQTNVEGVYAAGSCVSQGGQTILTCAENGEKAGLNASFYVKRLKEES